VFIGWPLRSYSVVAPKDGRQLLTVRAPAVTTGVAENPIAEARTCSGETAKGEGSTNTALRFDGVFEVQANHMRGAR
jgi:hypothetical protein